MYSCTHMATLDLKGLGILRRCTLQRDLLTYLLTDLLDLLMLFGCPGDVGGSSVGHLRWSSRCSVDWEYEHRPWRQQDALSGQQRTNQVHAVHSHAVRSPRSCRRVAGYRQPVRRHSLGCALIQLTVKDLSIPAATHFCQSGTQMSGDLSGSTMDKSWLESWIFVLATICSLSVLQPAS